MASSSRPPGSEQDTGSDDSPPSGGGRRATAPSRTVTPPASFKSYDGPNPSTASTSTPPNSATCPECSGSITEISVAGVIEEACDDCGLILGEDRLDRGPEWGRDAAAADSNGHNVCRVNGAPNDPTMHDFGLGSEVGRRGEHPSNSGVSVSQRNRMRRWHSQSRQGSSVDRNRAYAFNELKRVRSALDFGRSIEQRAAMLFRRAQAADLLTGRGIEQFVGAALYAAAREREIARLPNEIAAELRLTAEDTPGNASPTDSVRSAYGTMCRELGLTLRPLPPAAHIPRIADRLSLSPDVRHRARVLAEQTTGEQAVVGKAPTSVAAGVIYLAAKQVNSETDRPDRDPLTQRVVGEAAGVGEQALRDAYRTIEDLDADTTGTDESDSNANDESVPEQPADRADPVPLESTQLTISESINRGGANTASPPTESPPTPQTLPSDVWPVVAPDGGYDLSLHDDKLDSVPPPQHVAGGKSPPEDGPPDAQSATDRPNLSVRLVAATTLGSGCSPLRPSV